MRVGEVKAVLADLHARHTLTTIRTHEETGLIATWVRDRAVAAWARKAGVGFVEHRQHGVIRALKSRNGWARRWDAFMSAPVIAPPARLRAAGLASDAAPSPEILGLEPDPCPLRQRGGRSRALADLTSFLAARGRDYRRAMSAPGPALGACSRLSADLALGAISMREAFHAATKALAAKRTEGDARHAQSIESFIARLHWHCHFMQKFEDEPEIERRDLHPAYRGARPEPDAQTVQRWIKGRTGYPFLDACMRMLDQTGWLNFRMRAMAAAFSSYHLWSHWKRPAEALARAFVDFEPGIHYAQFQMQSGTTGVNTPRIYNPVKQSRDHDPDGAFIRRWAPELARLPTPFVHEPWTAPNSVLHAAGVMLGETYPERIVDHVEAARFARGAIARLRQSDTHAPEAAAIQSKHGSRRSGLKQTGSARARRRVRPSATDPRQGELDL